MVCRAARDRALVIAVKPKGELLLPRVQRTIRSSYCQCVFWRVPAARGRDEEMLPPHVSPAKPALPLAGGQGISAASAAHPWGAFGQAICVVCGASSQSSQSAKVLNKH